MDLAQAELGVEVIKDCMTSMEILHIPNSYIWQPAVLGGNTSKRTLGGGWGYRTCTGSSHAAIFVEGSRLRGERALWVFLANDRGRSGRLLSLLAG